MRPSEAQEIGPDGESAIAARLMLGFAHRTGLSSAAQHPQRYLWTDAFAVCNFLELSARTADQNYRLRAIGLIDQVHRVLGKFRDDDARRGWISGLDEDNGGAHPTARGLRIGKPLKERDSSEPLDERLEWDRDGQYFHYLTKWMHALCQAAFAIHDSSFSRWAVELAAAAFEGFARRSGSGDVVGVYWKMSTDLSRPLVPAMGLHDALDGFITFREAQYAASKMGGEAPDLAAAINSLSALCQHRDWATDDPLGLGGLLFDACRLCQLPDEGPFDDASLLEEILSACHTGLMACLAGRSLSGPSSRRLAFRELGLAIGLRALPVIAGGVDRGKAGYGRSLRQAADRLLPYESLSEEILGAWLPLAQHPDETWRAHQDINEVMLATALIPNTFLSVGERVSLPSRKGRAA